MPIYEYKAFASGGAAQTGIIDADTERDARQKLRRDNLLVSDLHELRGGRRRKRVKGKGKAKGGSAADSGKEGLLARIARQRTPTSPTARNSDVIAGLTRQLATLLGSGIPLAQALSALVEQAEQRKIETMFREIREQIEQGANLADALAQHPAYFSPLYVNMVHAGQATGNLDIVLSRIADYLKAQGLLRRKITSAMLYPVMMILIGMVVVAILMAKVVPEITSMLIDQGKKLPPSTQVLINLSEWFKSYWFVGFLVVAVFSFAFERIYQANKGGRLKIDRTLIKIPVLGELLRKAAVGRFTRTLSTLLQSGVPVIQALEITENVVGNRVVADATGYIRERVVEGTDLTTPLKQSGAFPSVVGYMVAVGEQSGELEQMLDRIALAYDEEIDVVTERFTALLEPIMIVMLAAVVGYIVFAIVQPILEIGQV